MENEDAGQAGWNPQKIEQNLYDSMAKAKDKYLESVNPDVVDRVMKELKHVNPDDTNVIFIFSEGDVVITAVHTPRETLDGRDGPVLTQGADDKVVIAAFSRESILDLIRKVDSDIEQQPGLLPWAENIWTQELENLANAVKLELVKNPPQKWEETWLGDLG